MTTHRSVALGLLCSIALFAACSTSRDSTDPGISPEAVTAVLSRGSDARPLTLNHHALALNWGITKSQEQGCGGSGIAGGDIGGNAGGEKRLWVVAGNDGLAGVRQRGAQRKVGPITNGSRCERDLAAGSAELEKINIGSALDNPFAEYHVTRKNLEVTRSRRGIGAIIGSG